VSSRPRPKSRIQIDVHNPYAELGVSPLASLEDIEKAADDRRGKLMSQRRTEGPAVAAEVEARIMAIQELSTLIGDRDARATYDREHPQSTLLTVQAGPRDRALGAAGAMALVTAWLAEELGPNARLVHPDALWLWLPAGLDPALARELARFSLDPADVPAMPPRLGTPEAAS